MTTRLLETPDDEIWPGVTTLPDYKSSFPSWHAKDLSDNVAGITSTSAEMLAVRLKVFTSNLTKDLTPFCLSF